MGANSKSLKTMLELMDSGELALPEIQRDFVWNRNNVLLLFDSLYRGLPIGYMLVWKAKSEVGRKMFKGKIKRKVGQNIDSFYGYLLDGQQRLTAIKLVKDGDENYPLMFALYPQDDGPDEGRFSWRSSWTSDNPWFVPVADIINGEAQPYELLERVRKEGTDFDSEKDSNNILASASRLQAIMDYEVGVIEYEDNHYRKATELFIRFNSTGKKLKGMDLIAAELALSVPELVSNSINRACHRFAPRFCFSTPFLIQCLAANYTGKMKLKKPKDIWTGKEKAIRKSWKKTEIGLGRTIEFLTGSVKWDSDTLLPSINSIIPLVYLFSRRKLTASERRKARNWLLAANIHAVFSGAVYSELDRILRGLGKKPTIQKLINLTRRETGKIKPYHFETRRKTGAAMSLYISMLRNCHARDWQNRNPLDGSVIGHNAELQVHHFFPQALLLKKGYYSEKINTFANYTIISKDTNLEILKEEPASYIKKLRINKKDLEDQCIPLDKRLWLVDRYDDFIAARLKLLANRLNEFLT